MGMAFTPAGVAGSRADVYFGAIDELASLRQADPAEVLGYVVAHELGHLLGLGHFAGGIMSSSWNDKMLKTARKRWLKFNESQCAAIHSRIAEKDTARVQVQTHGVPLLLACPNSMIEA